MNQHRKDELDVLLEQLATIAQQQPLMAKERQLALSKLISLIIESSRLSRPARGEFSASIYRDVYDEALQELMLYICQNINKYDRERGGVMTWVNVLMERRFFKEAAQKIVFRQQVSKMSLSDLDNLVPEEEAEDLTEILTRCINLDPENLFKKEHIAKYPHANFQALAQRRIVGKSWKEIAEEFNLKIPTVSSFYYRCINKYADKIKMYCRDYAI